MQQINEILDAKLLEQHKNQEKRNYLGEHLLSEAIASDKFSYNI